MYQSPIKSNRNGSQRYPKDATKMPQRFPKDPPNRDQRCPQDILSLNVDNKYQKNQLKQGFQGLKLIPKVLSRFFLSPSYAKVTSWVSKNSAYGRHRISRPMRLLEAPIPIKYDCFIKEIKILKIRKKIKNKI